MWWSNDKWVSTRNISSDDDDEVVEGGFKEARFSFPLWILVFLPRFHFVLLNWLHECIFCENPTTIITTTTVIKPNRALIRCSCVRVKFYILFLKWKFTSFLLIIWVEWNFSVILRVPCEANVMSCHPLKPSGKKVFICHLIFLSPSSAPPHRHRNEFSNKTLNPVVPLLFSLYFWFLDLVNHLLTWAYANTIFISPSRIFFIIEGNHINFLCSFVPTPSLVIWDGQRESLISSRFWSCWMECARWDKKLF